VTLDNKQLAHDRAVLRVTFRNGAREIELSTYGGLTRPGYNPICNVATYSDLKAAMEDFVTWHNGRKARK